MSGRVRLAAWASISALVLGTCGCAASNPARPDSKPSPQSSRSSPSMAMQQSVQLSPLDPRKQPVELRTEMEELFGQDVFVSVRVIRSRLRSDPDFTQAAVSAFFRNSNDLTTLFGRVYGSARAGQFRRLWEAQQDALVAYARADSQHVTRPRRPPPAASSMLFPGG